MVFSRFWETMQNRYVSRHAQNNYSAAANIFTHITDKEKYKLYQLAKGKYKSGGRDFLEIGSYLGASSVIIASALGNRGQLYCVDTWQNDTMSEGRRDTYEEFIHNTRGQDKKITMLRGLSVEIASNFSRQLDFIFFDGDHSYAGVKLDVDLWLPKLVSGGMVVCHDCGWAEGVQKVIAEEIIPRSLSTGHLPNMFWATLR